MVSGVHSYNIHSQIDDFLFTLPHTIVENTQDWELVPETPKMEVAIKDGYIYPIEYPNGTIIITNPTPQAKQIINAVMNGKVYERYVDKHTIEGKQFSGEKMNTTPSHNYGYKIYIIESEDGK